MSRPVSTLGATWPDVGVGRDNHLLVLTDTGEWEIVDYSNPDLSDPEHPVLNGYIIHPLQWGFETSTSTPSDTETSGGDVNGGTDNAVGTGGDASGGTIDGGTNDNGSVDNPTPPDDTNQSDNENGNPVLVKNVATVSQSSAPRVGQAGLNDSDDVVEGIVVMRKGENPGDVLKLLKAKITEINDHILPPLKPLSRRGRRNQL